MLRTHTSIPIGNGIAVAFDGSERRPYDGIMQPPLPYDVVKQERIPQCHPWVSNWRCKPFGMNFTRWIYAPTGQDAVALLDAWTEKESCPHPVACSRCMHHPGVRHVAMDGIRAWLLQCIVCIDLHDDERALTFPSPRLDDVIILWNQAHGGQHAG